MDYKELIKKLRAHKIKTDFGRFSPEICRKAADAIETLLVEREAAIAVVRCKDCKHCILTGRPPFMYHACNRIGAIRAVDEDDFCKHGTPPDCERTER